VLRIGPRRRLGRASAAPARTAFRVPARSPTHDERSGGDPGAQRHVDEAEGADRLGECDGGDGDRERAQAVEWTSGRRRCNFRENMLPRALTAIWLVTGTLANPVAPLVCGGADEAETAACCRQKANECNRAGMADDCCRTIPGSDDGAPTVARAQPATHLDRAPVFAPAVLATAIDSSVGFPGRSLDATVRNLIVDTSPPPFSVLRV